jgi:addiction module HigA family antidote
MTPIAIHPGEHLAEELKLLGMSAAELARRLDVPTNRVTGILNGQRAITGDTALRLAHFFGTSAEFWLHLQSLYENPPRPEEGWEINFVASHIDAPRPCSRVMWRTLHRIQTSLVISGLAPKTRQWANC